MTIEQLLEENKKELKGMSVVNPDGVSPLLVPNMEISNVSDEEFICLNEIKKLKSISIVEELTYEQCKKLDVYVKTLLSIRLKKDKRLENTEDLSEEALLESIK